MRIVIQRVLNATLTSQDQVVSKIGPGLMVLCGVTHTDNEIDIDYIIPKILKLKLWDHKGKSWNGNVVEMGY